MFAILISNDNLSKIEEKLTPGFFYRSGMSYYLKSEKKWYVVTGYVTQAGEILDWTIFPGYIIEEKYEHDPAAIQTDWDQIVKK